MIAQGALRRCQVLRLGPVGDVELDALLLACGQLGEGAGGDAGEQPGVNDFLVKAAALALMQVPEVNSSWGDAAVRRPSKMRKSRALLFLLTQLLDPNFPPYRRTSLCRRGRLRRRTGRRCHACGA